jgi:hypothetical protein
MPKRAVVYKQTNGAKKSQTHEKSWGQVEGFETAIMPNPAKFMT